MVTRTKVLEMLHEEGLDAFGAYEESALGWFGWEIHGDVLSVAVEHADGTETIYRWRLDPID